MDNPEVNNTALCAKTARARRAASDLAKALRRTKRPGTALATGPLDGDVIQPLPFARKRPQWSPSRDTADAEPAARPTRRHSGRLQGRPLGIALPRRTGRGSHLLNGIAVGAIALAIGWGSHLALDQPEGRAAASHAGAVGASTAVPPRHAAFAAQDLKTLANRAGVDEGAPAAPPIPRLVREIKTLAASQFADPPLRTIAAIPQPQIIVPPKPRAVASYGPPGLSPAKTVTTEVTEHRFTSATIDRDITPPKPIAVTKSRKRRLPKRVRRAARRRVAPIRRVRPPKVGMPRWAERAFNRSD
ncbi:MAG: hypothetical protein AAFQ45_09000 [Pseudomonadota bacterium]